jgi:peptide alpha-N-acetyltransferase
LLLCFADNTARALQLIDTAIAHTPTVVDLYVCKGRIYQHAGDAQRAFQCLEQARSLDLADRYEKWEM